MNKVNKRVSLCSIHPAWCAKQAPGIHDERSHHTWSPPLLFSKINGEKAFYPSRKERQATGTSHSIVPFCLGLIFLLTSWELKWEEKKSCCGHHQHSAELFPLLPCEQRWKARWKRKSHAVASISQPPSIPADLRSAGG